MAGDRQSVLPEVPWIRATGSCDPCPCPHHQAHLRSRLCRSPTAASSHSGPRAATATSSAAGKGGMRRCWRGDVGVQGGPAGLAVALPSLAASGPASREGTAPRADTGAVGRAEVPVHERGHTWAFRGQRPDLGVPGQGTLQPREGQTPTAGWGGSGDTAVWPGSRAGSWNQGKMEAREQSPCWLHGEQDGTCFPLHPPVPGTAASPARPERAPTATPPCSSLGSRRPWSHSRLRPGLHPCREQSQGLWGFPGGNGKAEDVLQIRRAGAAGSTAAGFGGLWETWGGCGALGWLWGSGRLRELSPPPLAGMGPEGSAGVGVVGTQWHRLPLVLPGSGSGTGTDRHRWACGAAGQCQGAVLGRRVLGWGTRDRTGTASPHMTSCRDRDTQATPQHGR